MKKRSPLGMLVRGFLLVILVLLAAIIAVASIGWWSGWTELANFRMAIQLAGVVVLGLGVMGAFARISIFQQDKPAAPESGQQAAQSRLAGFLQGYSFTLVMLTAGLACLMIGWLL